MFYIFAHSIYALLPPTLSRVNPPIYLVFFPLVSCVSIVVIYNQRYRKWKLQPTRFPAHTHKVTKIKEKEEKEETLIGFL